MENDEISSGILDYELKMAWISESNSMGYLFVGLNNGVTMRNGIDVMLNHTRVCLNLKPIPVGVLNYIDVFHCCLQCGKVYWEGNYFERFVKIFME